MNAQVIVGSILLFFSLSGLFAQTEKERARQMLSEAIEMMDGGQTAQSIELLEECKKLDPGNWVYDYEIAYAHVLDEEYKEAVIILAGLKRHPQANSLVYQMSGNCYSYMGQKEMALSEYKSGMAVFPNAGNLYLESGNIYHQKEEYDQAIGYYRDGISVDPNFPSNYYRLADLYLQSKDLMSGLVYAEIFMNLERSSQRTTEMSERMYRTYAEAIHIEGDSTRMDFCEVIIDPVNFEKEKKLPFCLIYGKHMALGTIGMGELNLSALARLRSNFITTFSEQDASDYPNVLFEYQKKMKEAGVFDAYNHYILQIGAPEEFEQWRLDNLQAFEFFIDWYSREENYLRIEQEEAFVGF